MKRFYSILLATVMLLSTMTFDVFATEDDIVREDLLTLACEVFPEYAQKIRFQGISSNQRAQRSLVVNETRQVSDNSYLIYTEYSDGIILLTDYEFDAYAIVTDSLTSSGATTCTVDIRAVCSNISGYFLVEDVKYTHVRSGYDSINSVGTYSHHGNCTIHTVHDPILTETATHGAELKYRLNFTAPGNITFNSLLTFTVRYNNTEVSHVDNT